MRILVVEDDKRLADALATILKASEYQCDVVYDGAEGLDYAQSGIYDCIVLDVMLPKVNGFDVASQLRRDHNPVPILMLTARSTMADKVGGLDAGADDYMTKPFAPVELLARIRSLTRRQGEVVFETMEYGNVTLDLQTCELSTPSKSVRLSQKELAIIRIFLANPTRVISKENLIDKVWGYDSTAEDNNVEAYISFLRKKLRYIGADARIATLRKQGYRLELNDDSID